MRCDGVVHLSFGYLLGCGNKHIDIAVDDVLASSDERSFMNLVINLQYGMEEAYFLHFERRNVLCSGRRCRYYRLISQALRFDRWTEGSD